MTVIERDALTGLATRSGLLAWLTDGQQRQEHPSGGGSRAVVVLAVVDLEDFAGVNVAYGQARGDQVLRAIASRLPAVAGRSGIAARVGGDAFVVGVRGEPAEPETLGRRLLEVVRGEVDLGATRAVVGGNVAVAVGGFEEPMPSVVRRLELALDRARRRGGQAIVVADEREDDRFNAGLSADLLQAVERDEIRVHYLPIVSLATGAVEGVEALARWHHDGEVLDAQAFIDVALKTGAIVPIGRYVMEQACRRVAAWNARHPSQTPLRVAVNASLHQLVEPDAVEHLARCLATSGLDPARLCIEMGEDSLSDLGEAVTPTLGALKALGVRLAVDDFGTGASSLVSLQRHRLDELKIDRSFIARMDEDESAAAIVRGIALLARSLGMELVAEGVERPAQEQMLRSLRCEGAQGWLYARPSEDLDEVVQAATAATAVSLERRQAEHQELWTGLSTPGSAARFVESVFEAAPIGMVLVDQTGRHLAANPAAAALLGREVDELLGMSCWELVHPADLQLDLAGMEQLLRGERPSYVVEERVLGADGEVRWVEVTVSGIPGDDRARGQTPRLLRQVRSIAADRELREAHQALEAHVVELGQANDRLASFAATLTHDLLQPVAALDGFLTLLDHHASELDAEHRDWLERAIRGKARLVDAVHSLHRAATEEQLELAPVPMGPLVAEVAEDFGRVIDDLVTPADGLPVVQGDRGMLAQVLANLLQNSVRYRSPDRSLRVAFDAAAEGDGWVVSVTDTGLGIAPDEVEAVFESGVRGRSAEDTLGTGTGLATVRALMHRMGGAAWAEAHEGGARLCLRLRGTAG